MFKYMNLHAFLHPVMWQEMRLSEHVKSRSIKYGHDNSGISFTDAIFLIAAFLAALLIGYMAGT